MCKHFTFVLPFIRDNDGAQGFHRNTHSPQSIVVSGWCLGNNRSYVCLLSDSLVLVFTPLVELNSVHFQILRAQSSLCIIGYSNMNFAFTACVQWSFIFHAYVNPSAISQFINAHRMVSFDSFKGHSWNVFGEQRNACIH